MEEQLEEVFDGPIPGSSLTGEPGLEPNENPPEIDHIVLANRKEDPRLREAIERVKEYESVIKPEENVKEKPEEDVEEKPEEDVEEKSEEADTAPVTGLMGNRSKT